MAAIGERERELRTITDRLLEPKPESLRSTLDELRTFAVSRLTSIRELIAHPNSVDQARAALAKHFGKFTLEPVTRDGKTSYLAHGEVDFFGDEARERVVPGARIGPNVCQYTSIGKRQHDQVAHPAFRPNGRTPVRCPLRQKLFASG